MRAKGSVFVDEIEITLRHHPEKNYLTYVVYILVMSSALLLKLRRYVYYVRKKKTSIAVWNYKSIQ